MIAPPDHDRMQVLVVDDNPGDVQLVRAILRESGDDIGVSVATNGTQALDLLRRGSRLPNVILTDLQMPQMSGLELVEIVHRDYPSLPVVVMTAYGNEAIAFQSLQKGAASYVPKSNLAAGLVATLRQMFEMSRIEQQDERLFGCLVEMEQHYLLDNDISLIPPLTRQLGQVYGRVLQPDETEQIRLSVALHEALVNAVFHGNLEMGSGLRDDADLTAGFYAQADKRRQRAPYRDRRVRLTARLTRDEAVYIVRDEGPGFNPATLPDPRDRSNIGKAAGRGLFLIRLFMDEVRHNAAGNEITMIKRRGPSS
jgi:CheY-like chemotaxis protein/anti-sigma regulatory factor (Ser/Thr protein kinase)